MLRTLVSREGLESLGYRRGFSRRQTLAHAATSRRFHNRPRPSSATGAGNPSSSAIWWARCLLTPRSSAISMMRTVRRLAIPPIIPPRAGEADSTTCHDGHSGDVTQARNSTRRHSKNRAATCDTGLRA